MYDIKFKVGDTVYPITFDNRPKEIPCTICDQKGTIIYRNRKLTCPECGGRKVVWNQNRTWKLGKASQITQISIGATKISCVLKESTSTSARNYFFSQHSFDINDCFKTIQEALEVCDIRNGNNCC